MVAAYYQWRGRLVSDTVSKTGEIPKSHTFGGGGGGKGVVIFSASFILVQSRSPFSDKF